MKALFTNKYFSLLLLIGLISLKGLFAQSDSTLKVFVFEIKDEIAKPAWRTTQKAIDEANAKKMDYIILHLNTYGGRVDIADSIRTKILNNTIPVIAFIDNQAISAGSLISIACDSIYMRPGGSIGAATVVSQTGEVVPDKYQSFMRSTMRATAEAHGKDTIINGKDTLLVWHRNPKVAEAMVDPKIYVPNISDSGQVLTLTADEAIKVQYCEGLAKNIPEVLNKMGIGEAEIYYYKKDGTEILIAFLLSTIVQSILVILIIGGIYFEFQTPGIGFPLGVAISAALLYFAPLYIEGLAQNWEMLVFIGGIILIGLEVFVIPGFGIAGFSGIILVLIGLTMSLVDNVIFELDGVDAFGRVVKLAVRIILTMVVSLVLSVYFSKKIGASTWFKGVALESVQQRSDGYIGIDVHQKEMIGKIGEAYTVLRPSGKVKVENEVFDAKSEIGFVDKGTKIKVIRDEAGQLYVIKA